MPRWLTVLALIMSLAGCARGLDRRLGAGGADALAANLATMMEEAPEAEAGVLRRYLPELLETPLVRADPSRMTGRDFLLANLREQRHLRQQLLVKHQRDAWRSAEIHKIVIDDIRHAVSKGVSGRDEFVISANLWNRSAVPVSTIWFRARAYVGDSPVPAAESEPYAFFEYGLPAGGRATMSIEPGGAFGTAGGWSQASVRKAKSLRISLEIVKAEDTDDNDVSPPRPGERDMLEASLSAIDRDIAIVAKTQARQEASR